jgi:hypothetical protein
MTTYTLILLTDPPTADAVRTVYASCYSDAVSTARTVLESLPEGSVVLIG